MKLAIKLSLAMGMLAALMTGLGIFCLLQMANISEQSAVITKGWMPRVALAEEMSIHASDYRIQQLQHIVAATPQEIAAAEKELIKLAGQFESKLDRLRTSLESSEASDILRQVEEVQTLWNAYRKASRGILALSEQNKKQEALAQLNGKARDAYLEIDRRLTNIITLATNGADAANMKSDHAYTGSRVMVISFLTIAVILAASLTLLIVRNTLRQLGRDPGVLDALAAEVANGRLDIEKDPNATGVYARVLIMVENLKKHIENARQESERAQEESRKAHEAMQQADAASKDAQAKRDDMLKAALQLEDVAHVVSSASTQLSAQIAQSEHGASEQAARVTETATAMEEMNATVIEVAKNAGNASEVSAATRQKAEHGASVVQEAVISIRGVQQASLALKDDMAKLSENAQAISQIMAVISDIADQTNLLALNAAIEAARAGDAGRGFAVVADEVRKLAEKTMASTADVGNAIKTIQDSAAKSMEQVDHTVENIEKSTELATRSGDALREIVSMVDNTADQVRGIATASEQQSASSEEINRSIVQVNTIAAETASAMQEAARAVSDLAQQAQVLTGLIEDMKNA